MTAALVIATLSLVIWLYLILAHGGFWLGRENDDALLTSEPPAQWPRVAAVIPARNEADMIPLSLPTLMAQDYPGDFTIFLIDDQSEDGTASIAQKLGQNSQRFVTVIPGADRPHGWTGKVWAQHQGIAQATEGSAPPDYLLLTDADIGYAPNALSQLVRRAQLNNAVLTSLMAKLACESCAERALVPAFIFFFQMLYPFRWINRRTFPIAGAAGGCMLVERTALERAGGIQAIRGALIDDCALAKVMKAQGAIWLGLSERVRSLRPYPHVKDIRHMVSRSAYAQLRYSPLLLAGTIGGLALTYLAAPVLAMFAGYPANIVAALAWAFMALSFQPTLQRYGRSALWGLALPGIALVYLVFTIDSAYQHGRGRGGMWKGRAQANETSEREAE